MVFVLIFFLHIFFVFFFFLLSKQTTLFTHSFVVVNFRDQQDGSCSRCRVASTRSIDAIGRTEEAPPTKNENDQIC